MRRDGDRHLALNGDALRRVLRARAAMETAVRLHFAAAGFLEVTTPVALPHPNLDPHVRPVPVRLHDFSGRESALWLHTSPELAMKKLVARGSGSIFQVAPVFRDGEVSPRHRCEFSMLEWYRVGADWRAVRDDAVAIIAAAARAVTGGTVVRFAGREHDLAGGWEETTVEEALRRETGVRSLSRDDLVSTLLARGVCLRGDEPRDELFFRLYLEAEPGYGAERPLVVRDFPAFLGTMARPSPADPDVLERFELYAGGLELANGYSELTDAVEQARRMKETRQALEEEGAPGLTVDDDFLASLKTLPACAGVSIGLDRLLMLLLGEEEIASVLPL